MEVAKIQLEYMQKGDADFSLQDPLSHIKTLPYLSVVQAVTGDYGIQLRDDQMRHTDSGGFFIAPSDVQQTIIHHADPLTKKMVCRWVFLKVKLNDLFDFDYVYEFPCILPDLYRTEMNCIFDRLFAADNSFDEYVCYYEIVRLLFSLSKEKSPVPTSCLHTALTYIKNNYTGKITVADIAKEVNLSESHLFALFKNTLGTSPISYLNSYRLSVAVDVLLKSDRTIVEIANMVGIEDSVYFNKLFRKTYQISPSQYRKLYKNSETHLL